MIQNNKIKERRLERLQNTILDIFNHTLKYEIYNKEIKMASFTYVKLSPDKINATIYVDTFKRDQIDRVVETLNESVSVFRRALAENLESRKIPNIIFRKDESIDRALYIENLLKK
ncbi:MAG: 30S ribosome-binding factor RbfA [Mycoplasmataceae bacterium]|jgi:ribosome-binding factor A|nr:30S ribosome-binding factor RbfA [Mycoplasmataceae bacterium]